jgi:hypothetical protein
MPAARPSQASVSNAIAAVVAAGLSPAAIDVRPDGSFQILLTGHDATPLSPRQPDNSNKTPSGPKPLTRNDIQCA